MSHEPVVVGIDVGTQGARVVAHDPTGLLIAAETERFGGDWSKPEQNPDDWWQAVVRSLRRLVDRLEHRPIAGISVTSTSGTVIPLDRNWQPVAPALMYNDRRATQLSDEIAERFPDLGVSVSWGLPKIVWFEQTHPTLAKTIHGWRHPVDFLIGRLTGEWESTDQTSALKSGFDLVHDRWPTEVFATLGIDSSQLPTIRTTGEIAGYTQPFATENTGLPAGIPVLFGMTDGCASQVSTGAMKPGSWSSTIGTTLVVKGTTIERIVDPLDRIYDHRHPQGFWMPGAASNTGAGWISAWFPDRDPNELDCLASTLIPTGKLAWPLVGTGERFPFKAPSATGFGPTDSNDLVRYAAALEGVAYLERMAFDLIEELSGEPVQEISTAGGGSAGDTWLRIRANVLNRPIRKVRNANAASGAAMIAASGIWYSGLIETVEHMVELDRIVEPDQLIDTYQQGYERFRAELSKRGYSA